MYQKWDIKKFFKKVLDKYSIVCYNNNVRRGQELLLADGTTKS